MKANTNSRLLAPVILLALTGSLLTAQQRFIEAGKRHLPIEMINTYEVELGDVDGDGAVDLIAEVCDVNGCELRFYRNSGNGVFVPASSGTTRISAVILPQLKDLDGDGDLDLICKGQTRFDFNRVYVNDGKGAFRLVSDLGKGGGNLGIGDVDGDGDPDVVVGSSRYQPAALWLNDGKGRFAVAPSRVPSTYQECNQIVLTDVDGDRDLDIVCAMYWYYTQYRTYSGQNQLYLNDGTGKFIDVTSSHLPIDSDMTTDLTAADVDNDGDVDLVFSSATRPTKLYINGGQGRFTDQTAGRMPSNGATWAVLFVDIDRDGDADLVEAGFTGALLALNDGTGRFRDATAARLPANLAFLTSVATADVGGNRAPDLVFGGNTQNFLLLNNGAGIFADGTARPAPIHGSPWLGFGDIDGDGDPDLVTGSLGCCADTMGAFYRNDGHGNFRRASQGSVLNDPDGTFGPMVFVDVDGDTDQDLLFISGNTTHGVKLYLNDGKGGFTNGTIGRLPPMPWPDTFALGDVDGDGDPDLVLGLDRVPNKLFLNDGRGKFTEASGRLPAANDRTTALVLGDVDGDGDVDIVMGNYGWPGKQTRLFLNDGSGRFLDATFTHMPKDDGNTRSLAIGDVDNDGDLDLVLGNHGTNTYKNQRNQLYVNDGNGRFKDVTATQMPNVISGCANLATSVSLGDVDGDGDLDLVVGVCPFRGHNELWLNDGRGTFKSSGRVFTSSSGASQWSRLIDVDGDGDLDLFVGGRLYTNQHRHVHTPHVARLGHTFLLEFSSEPGYGRSPRLALPYASPGETRIPLPPFGLFGLDPAAMIALPPVVIAQATGSGSLVLPVPNRPVFKGQSLFVQALILTSTSPNSWRLTNVTSDVVDSW